LVAGGRLALELPIHNPNLDLTSWLGQRSGTMRTTCVPLRALTAGDLMSRDIKTVPAGMPLRDAAKELARLGVRGAPVVDGDGRFVGVLSVSDLARWAARGAGPSASPPRDCDHQEVVRESGGQETVVCTLRPGGCALQRVRARKGGPPVVACADPHGVCTDWQAVDVASLPAEDVRHAMTAWPVTAGPSTPLPGLARQMLASAVHRVVVVDTDGRPIGIVSATDILRAVANTDSATTGDAP
jgi:CBS domain-containing protein